MLTCSLCDRDALARGLCSAHYARLRRTGRPQSDVPVAESAQHRFDRHVDRSAGPEGCWPWTGGVGRGGYGRFSVGSRNVYAHRFALFGEAGAEVAVLHSCDNPPCVNPAHLWAGTLAENNRDRDAKGRGATAAQMGHAKLDQQIAEEIRRRYAAGGISQQRIADDLGISQALVSQVVREVSWRRR